MEAIVAFFASIGYPLEHFPETEEMGELWQYDGYPGNEKCVQLTLGRNGLGKLGVFGSVDLTYEKGYDVSCSVDGWLATFQDSVTKLLVDGDDSGW